MALQRALVVVRVAKAKNRDSGRSMHFRPGKQSQSANSTCEETQRGGKGSSKTTRSQRTNKTYKQRVSGRPSVDDVERASRGDRTKAMGVVEREAPYRLTRDEREAWERAKKRGVLETRSTSKDALAPHRFPLVNTHRAYCDATARTFVCVEQDAQGEDEVVVDLSTLRARADGAARARLMTMGVEVGAIVDDLCGDEEPLAAQMRYVAVTKAGLERTALVELLDGGEVETTPSPSEDDIDAARDAVAIVADRVRALKDSGKSNADEDVKAGVQELISLKATLEAMEAAASQNIEGSDQTGVNAAEELESVEEEARRSIEELPIHGLPERFMRFKCSDRAMAKSLSKAISQEDLSPLCI